nr:hypothetical protein [uncultured bacterium]
MTAPLATERRPPSPVSPSLVPPEGTAYHVQDFDTWASIASEHHRDAWELIAFNFRTRDPDEVSWYLREYVGCTQVAPDGHNWDFTSGITGGKGAWKGGVIYLPPENVSFEPMPVLGQSDALLSSRLPNAEDRSAGKDFFEAIMKAAHEGARKFGELDESTVDNIISEATEIYEKTEDVITVAEAMLDFEIVGELASTLMGPLGSAVQVVELLREIGYSNQIKDIAQRRRTYYQALAGGLAIGLDEAYRPPVPQNALLAGVFQVGQNIVEHTSVRKRLQLMVELIENGYFQSAYGDRPQSIEEYRALLKGQVFYQAVMNRFEHHEYLWR